MKPRSITIQIDELVLNGLGTLDRRRVGIAIQQELARRLAESPTTFIPGRHAALDAGMVSLQPAPRSEALGRQVAQAVHKRLPK